MSPHPLARARRFRPWEPLLCGRFSLGLLACALLALSSCTAADSIGEDDSDVVEESDAQDDGPDDDRAERDGAVDDDAPHARADAGPPHEEDAETSDELSEEHPDASSAAQDVDASIPMAPGRDAAGPLHDGGRSADRDAQLGSADAGGPATDAGADTRLTERVVFLAGDSTVSQYGSNYAPQAGWGQMLQERLDSRARVDNRAIGGRTARRFLSEGRLDDILAKMKSGDHLLVQFGTNDSNRNATYKDDGSPYYSSPADFSGYLRTYIEKTRARGGIAVLVTPPPRRSCTGDSHTFGNGVAGYAEAMRKLAVETKAPLVDLNAMALEHLEEIGCQAAAEVYLYAPAGMYTGAYAKGVSDSTHLQAKGAKLFAGLIANALAELDLPLAAYVRSSADK